jgi:hypothetical protein
VASFNAWWIWPAVSQPSSWQWGADLLLASCSLVDAAIMMAVYRSPYYRQMFSEFPNRVIAASTSSLGDGLRGTGLRTDEPGKKTHGP